MVFQNVLGPDSKISSLFLKPKIKSNSKFFWFFLCPSKHQFWPTSVGGIKKLLEIFWIFFLEVALWRRKKSFCNLQKICILRSLWIFENENFAAQSLSHIWEFLELKFQKYTWSAAVNGSNFKNLGKVLNHSTLILYTVYILKSITLWRRIAKM